MKIKELIRQLIKDYFVIFGILIIGAVFLVPAETINRDYILLAMTFAALGDLPIVVLWSRSELSEESRQWRAILHFALLEAVILIYAGMIGLVSSLSDYAVFAVEILVIYLLVRLIAYRGDLATAKKINQRLKNFKVIDD